MQKPEKIKTMPASKTRSQSTHTSKDLMDYLKSNNDLYENSQASKVDSQALEMVSREDAGLSPGLDSGLKAGLVSGLKGELCDFKLPPDQEQLRLLNPSTCSSRTEFEAGSL